MTDYIARWYDEEGNVFRQGGNLTLKAAQALIAKNKGLNGKVYSDADPDKPVWTAPEVRGE